MDNEDGDQLVLVVEEVVAASVEAVLLEPCMLEVAIYFLIPSPRSIAQAIAVSSDLVQLCRVGIGGNQNWISWRFHPNWSISLAGVLLSL